MNYEYSFKKDRYFRARALEFIVYVTNYDYLCSSKGTRARGKSTICLRRHEHKRDAAASPVKSQGFIHR